MKTILILGLVLVVAKSGIVLGGCGGDGCKEVPASLQPGDDQTLTSYETFMSATYNDSCSSCSCRGCCPVIVRNCAPKYVGSVIQGFTGWRGNAAIIIDWGCTAYNPCGCCPKGRICTVNDKGYRWYIDWGDGQSDHGYQRDIGPFQETHQYSKDCQSRTYGVTVYFCHDPGCPSERCCDSIYRRIDVSEDPARPHPDIDFGKPLEIN